MDESIYPASTFESVPDLLMEIDFINKAANALFPWMRVDYLVGNNFDQ